MIPDLERDLEPERDLDLESFLPFLPSFLPFLLLGLRLRLRSFILAAPLLPSSSSFLPFPLFFLLRERLREWEAALERERLRLLLSLRLRLLRDLRFLERDLRTHSGVGGAGGLR